MAAKTSAQKSAPIPLLKDLYLRMLRIRAIEESIAARYREQEMRCPIHLSIGQEAPAVGVCAALEPGDYAMSTHRSHGHYLGKGGDLKAMLAEFYGRAAGCSVGKGGSMHLIDTSVGFLGATPIVGATIAIATGAAFGVRLRGEKRVVAAFFGEGATEEGVFHEAMNFASLKKLPIVFVCENNLYSVYSPLSVRQPARPLAALARAHAMKAMKGDGNDVVAARRLAQAAVKHARSGAGPVFLELDTYRWREHCGPNYDNDIGYRTEAEFQKWKRRDPLALAEKKLAAAKAFKSGELAALKAGFQAEIDEAFRYAKSCPFPDKSELLKEVYAGGELVSGKPVSAEARLGARELRYAQAIHEALDLCLAKDPSVYLMGLGVPDPKGIFGTTLGLQKKYGVNRVMDMPTAENGMTGVALGSALVGMRPVMVHQRLDFAVLAMEQIVNQAAKWHYMFGAKAKAPMVIRLVVGRGWGQGTQHSQSLHAWFAHIPGLKVVLPATAADAKGLLISAIEDDNPVIMIEHRWLHDVKGLVPAGVTREPIGKARVAREGTDVTLAAVSYMTIEALRAAEYLAEDGISAEVLDLRSVRPLDRGAILASVRKTGRLVMADIGWAAAGVSAEILALVSEQAFDALKCAPARLTLPDCPTPSTPALANDCYPRANDIAAAAARQLGRDFKPRPLPGPHDVPDATFTGPF